MATNKVLVSLGTQILFGSEVGDDVAWSNETLSDNAGRWSALHDLGAGPRTDWFSIEFWGQCQATPTIGAIVRTAVQAGGSETATPDHKDHDDGGDVAVSTLDKFMSAFHHPPPMAVNEAAANIEYVARDVFKFPFRHIGVGSFNESGATTTTDAAEMKARLTPLTPDIAAAA